MSRSITPLVTGLAPVLFLTGMFLNTSALGLVYIQQDLTALPRLMLGLGLTLSALSGTLRLRLLLWGANGQRLVMKVTVIGGVAAGVIGFFGLNVFAEYPDARYDLTSEKSHTLDPTTMAALGRLDRTVHISALYVGPVPDHVKDLLAEFGRVGGSKVVTEMFDPLVNLGRAAEFGSRIEGQDRRVVVWTRPADGSVGRREEINCKDADLTPERLTTALVRVTRGGRQAYFLTGHGEYDPEGTGGGSYAKLKAALETQQVAVKPLVLATRDEVARDADVLVIGGPQLDPDPDEIVKIRRFLQEGGHLLLMTRGAIRTEDGTGRLPGGVTHPTFAELLRDWWVELGDDVVVDLKNHLGNDIGCPAVNRYPKHEKIVANLGISYFVRPRSVRWMPDPPSWLLRAPLVQTMGAAGSWAETSRDLYVHYDPGVDLNGPVTLGVVVVDPLDRRRIPVAPGLRRSPAAKLVVFGESSFVTDELVDRYSNLDLVVNCVTWLADREPMLASRLQEPALRKLEVTPRDLRIALVVSGLVPAVILFLGLGVWWRRSGYGESD